MEQMCIASFLYHGHPFHLYAYSPVEGAPPGTVVMDGNEILPESSIFQYTDHASYAGFANFFRYKLLLERGGWWVDLDLICMRPFNFDQRYVFSSEFTPYASNQAIKVPPRSAVMTFAWLACKKLDPKQLKWAQTGPILVANAVEAAALQQYIQAPHVFCPVPFEDWAKVLDPHAAWDFSHETYAIHLWNELWRRDNRSKDTRYDEGCLYEVLKKRYLPSC
jgi:hypothetical protein